ncbi:MAG TPA: rod shape-determining protein, partial [Candidatus Paceibacterota bacterium]|nr:rod shape-determining protein [Candidatus Paceibacterota bacterium]
EKIKIEAGAALPQKNKIETEAKGRDLTTGLPRAVVVNSNEIAEALTPHLEEIAESIRSVFLNTPPELAADIIEKGIVIAGGSALLRDLDLYISKVTGVNTFLAEDALYCVAKGTGIVLEHLDIYKRALMSKR